MATHQRAAGAATAALIVDHQPAAPASEALSLIAPALGGGAPSPPMNAAHWRAVDIVAATLAGESGPSILVSAPGLGADAVIAAAEEAAFEPADEFEGEPRPTPSIAPVSADFDVVANALAELCGVDAAGGSSALAGAIRQNAMARAYQERPLAALLILPSAPLTAEIVGFLDECVLSASGRLEQALRLVIVADAATAAEFAALSTGPLRAAPHALLRPHGPDEVRSFLRRAAHDPRAAGAPATPVFVAPDVAWAAYQATGGSPELLAALGAAAGAPTRDSVQRATDAARLGAEQKWDALRAVAFTCADASDMPECDETPTIELEGAFEPEPEEAPADPAHSAEAPPLAKNEYSPPPAAGRRDVDRKALLKRLRRQAARRRRLGAFCVAASLVVSGLTVLSGVVFKDAPISRSAAPPAREAVLDLAEGALDVAGATIHAVASPHLGALGRALAALGDDADDAKRDLARARATLKHEGAAAGASVDKREARIVAALKEAARHSAAGRYVAPIDASAYSALLKVERLAPADPRLNAAFKLLETRYADLSRAALGRADFDRFYRANNIVDRIRARRPIRDNGLWQ